jgi:hypothetical protein
MDRDPFSEDVLHRFETTRTFIPTHYGDEQKTTVVEFVFGTVFAQSKNSVNRIDAF